MPSLTLAERRSLALHQAVAARLREDPRLVERARTTVIECEREGRLHPQYARQWRELLQLPLEELIVKLLDHGEEMCALRQTTPFAGVLEPRQRWRILRETA